jgi:hypothetical protein
MSDVSGRLGRILRENWLFLLVVSLVVGVFLVLRTPSSDIASSAELEGVLADGQPTLVEFYSNT